MGVTTKLQIAHWPGKWDRLGDSDEDAPKRRSRAPPAASPALPGARQPLFGQAMGAEAVRGTQGVPTGRTTAQQRRGRGWGRSNTRLRLASLKLLIIITIVEDEPIY